MAGQLLVDSGYVEPEYIDAVIQGEDGNRISYNYFYNQFVKQNKNI